MNIQKLMISTALVVAATATAGAAIADTRYPVDAPFVSTKTRAEVIAELPQAGNQARLTYARTTYPAEQTMVSTKTRAEVVAQLSPTVDEGRENYIKTLYPTNAAAVAAKRAQVRSEVALADTRQKFSSINTGN
ncbi:DUF4148 domain-containing protein [Glaciimonas sp. GG7]